MGFDETVRQSQQMLAALMGGSLRALNSFAEIQEYLQPGERDVMLTLLWNGAPHQLILQEVKNGRAYFFNPQAQNEAPGTEVGGSDDTPLRRAESQGIESFSVKVLQQLLLEKEAEAHAVLLPESAPEHS